MSSIIVKSRSDSPLQTSPQNGDTASILREILNRMDRMEAHMEELRSLSTQIPGLMAIGVDTLDEAVGQWQDNGVNVEHRMKHAARLLELATTDETVRQLETLLEISERLPGLLSIAVDSLDEMAMEADLDGIMKTATAAGTALAKTHAEPGTQIRGIFGLLRALRDPDRQRAMSFLMNFLKHFGKQLS
ncbi:MAG: DUF1641 domain-containing protein [Saprospiraceae bacterium]|nr:DUF1641 domain-containing protein [Saprospiraceae bacterium]